MFELYQLEQLLAVSECGTLSQAAEQLHLSQSALSRSMQRLEAELQVTLFTRQKNRIELNECGRMAVEHARRIVEQARDMAFRVQAFDRSQRTILVGSCAPAPLWEIPPLLSGLYPDRIISSELREPEALLSGLREGVYQLAVLPFAVEEAGLACTLYKEERLFFSLPPAHPLSGRKGLYLNDLNGETMLLLNRLGIWETIVHQRMPDTRFLVQEDFAFETLVRSSALPSFASDIGLQRQEGPRNRINIPVLDPEANITYYCVYRSEAHKELSGLFQALC